LLQGTFDIPGGRRCAQELFSREKSTWPDAIFVGNDQMAYGLLEVAEEQLVPIPEEVALVGFDDNSLSAHIKPPLTTIHQPFSEMGRKAIELLLTMIDPQHHIERKHPKGERPLEAVSLSENEQADQVLHFQLETSLVVRASSTFTRTLPLHQ
jgi:LacI family transcriptional regulator